MMNPLKTVKGTLILGFVTAVVIAVLINLCLTGGMTGGLNNWSLVVWLHVFFGIIWIGLLYYFNFVQTPAVAAATADSDGPGPAAISKYVAPLAFTVVPLGRLADLVDRRRSTGINAEHQPCPSIYAERRVQPGSPNYRHGRLVGHHHVV